MKIALIASEAVPFAKTGGLADVAGALPRYFRSLGIETSLYLPKYPGITAEPAGEIEIKISGGNIKVGIFRRDNAFFIDYPPYFDRPGLYGTPAGDYPDNLERFTLFSKAVAQLLSRNRVDIAHCHDWQTGLVPAFLKHDRSSIKTLFTIHNLGYQGRFPGPEFAKIGLPDEYFNPEGLEFYGDVNFLKGGIVYSDAVTTVSENYAREIQTAELGFGLDGILRRRQQDLYGIINGLDYDLWDPSRDQAIYRPYADYPGKLVNRLELIRECNIDRGKPLVGMVSRVAGQKGFDILTEIFDEMIQTGFCFVLLGYGEESYHVRLKEYESIYTTQVSINLKFDDRLARRIYAGCDFFLMPSRYEPCGLGQLISLKYGSIPVVRKTGGLADTVQEYDLLTHTGNGFLFEEYSGPALLQALVRAYEVYWRPDHLQLLAENAMRGDYSWNQSAVKYRDLYLKILQK
jgi:starch synthase